MIYPKSKPEGSPTPYDKLIVCDKCQVANWTIHCDGVQDYCHCQTRKREATMKEYTEEIKQRVK